MITAPPLLLSRLDVERIEALLESPSSKSLNTSALQDELARAEVLAPAAEGGIGPERGIAGDPEGG